jgi:hypothetical protein
VLSGDREAIAKLTKHDLEIIVVTTLSGLTVGDFAAEVKKWLASAKDPRWKRPYTDLTYQPMQGGDELLPRERAIRPTW